MSNDKRSARRRRKPMIALCGLAAAMCTTQVAHAREITVICSGTSTSANSNSYRNFNNQTQPKTETFFFDTDTRKFAGQMSDGTRAPGGNYEIKDGQLGFCRDLCGSDTRPGQDGEVNELELPKIWVDVNSGLTTFITAITNRAPNGEFFRQQTTFSGRCDTGSLSVLAELTRTADAALAKATVTPAPAASPVPAPTAAEQRRAQSAADTRAVDAANATALDASKAQARKIEEELAAASKRQADFEAAVAETRRRAADIERENTRRREAYEARMTTYKSCLAGDQAACTRYTSTQ